MPPNPGDFFISGGGAENSSLTGALTATAIRWGTSSPYNHAGVCVDKQTVVEAQPGGARRSPIAAYLGNNTRWSNGCGIPNPEVAQRVADAAISLVGTPYGWPDIVAITLAQKRLGHWRLVDAEKPEDQQPWWVRRLARTDRLICSQLVDFAYFQAGVHLFTDGRMFGLASPGDLGRLITQ